MVTGSERTQWRAVGRALVRVCRGHDLAVPQWPDLTGTDATRWARWLRQVWESPGIAEAIRYASPDLAARVEDLLTQEIRREKTRSVRKVTASVMRYLLRARHRVTPFGLFAGVAPAVFADCPQVVWRGERVVAAPTGPWVAEVVERLEALPDLRGSLHVVANNIVFESRERLVIPQTPGGAHRSGTSVERAEIGLTPALRLVMEAARAPLSWADAAAKVAAEYPDESSSDIDTMLARLVAVGALVTSLVPATTDDPLDHLLDALEAARADLAPQSRPLVTLLREAREAVREHNRVEKAGSLRRVERTMRHLAECRSLHVDLSVDADLALPHVVARTAEQAASMLTVLSTHPRGLPAWRDYRDRFVDRYGEALVPVTELTHPDTGLGLPAGYTGMPAERERTAVIGDRDRWLLEQAQRAALDGDREIAVDRLVAESADAEASPPPAHTELNLRIESPSPAALSSGRFRVAVLGVSRGAATMAGRFATLAGIEADLAQALSHTDTAAVPVQLSFPPLHARNAHLVRVPRLADHVIHVGEPPSPGSVPLDDLAVGHDEDGLFLWSSALGRRVAPVVPHALNLRFIPPLARFLAELPRAYRAVVSGFDWGAASHLPFLPRVRSGRVVLAGARWRIRAGELAPRTASWAQWEQAWKELARRRRIPALVEVGRDDQRLSLDLGEPSHLFLLRAYLNQEGRAVLTEAPDPRSYGWCGGQPTQVLVQLTHHPEGSHHEALCDQGVRSRGRRRGR